MTKRYIDGFLAKCAESGVDPETLLKSAGDGPGLASLVLAGLGGAAAGGGIGAVIPGRDGDDEKASRKRRIRRAIIVALIGGAAGVGGDMLANSGEPMGSLFGLPADSVLNIGEDSILGH